MTFKSKLSIALAIAGLLSGAIGTLAPANADNIVPNQWYAFGFSDTGLIAFAPATSTGHDGPLPGGGTGTSINPAAGTSWTITLTTVGYVVFTDLEFSGDRFQVFVNGVGATPTTNNLVRPARLDLLEAIPRSLALGVLRTARI